MKKIESITKIKSITIDFVKRIYLSAFLFLCCTLPVYACAAKIGIDDTVPPYYTLGLGGFLGLLIALTNKKDKHIAIDLTIFTGSYLFFLFLVRREIFMTFLFLFFIIYSIRVFNKIKKHKANVLLYLSIPFLFISVFILPPPMAILRCTTGCQSKLKNLGASLELYHQNNKEYPNNLDTLLSSGLDRKNTYCEPYIANLNAKNMIFYRNKYNLINTPYSYQVSSVNDTYTIWCNADYHKSFGYPKGYPQYNSTDGLIPRP